MTVEAVDGGAGMRVLVVRGDLDAAVAPSLLLQVPELVGEEARDVVLDLTDASFVDSGGLRLVDALHRRASDAGASFAVLAPERSPGRRLLLLVGLQDLLLDED